MTKLADDAATENAKKALEQERKLPEKSRSDFASRMKGKPTPTQEELDLTNCGAHIIEHEADGSDPDPTGQAVPGASGNQHRSMEAERSTQHRGGYATRSTTTKE